jgi:hypothetical protein
LSLNSERPRQSPYTNGLTITICTMELSGCEEECSRTANFCETFRCHEVLGLASVESYSILPTLLPSSPYRHHIKTQGLQKPSVPNIVGRRNKRAGIPAYGRVGCATGGQ